jgi:hypothetical protein
MDDRPVGKVVWCRMQDYETPRPYCEAPRHRARRHTARWLLLVVERGCEPLFQGMCEDCMGRIAADLGTTPEAGSLPAP